MRTNIKARRMWLTLNVVSTYKALFLMSMEVTVNYGSQKGRGWMEKRNTSMM